MRSAFLAGLTASLLSFCTSAWGQSGGVNACDLTRDGAVDFSDVDLAVKMALGTVPCTANIEGAGVCNTAVVQRVVHATLGGSCVTGTAGGGSHSVSLNWIASTSPNVVGYNVYRRTLSSAVYVKLNLSPVGLLTYTDSAIQPGVTYYYVATAVDSSGRESVFSDSIAQAVVPNP